MPGGRASFYGKVYVSPTIFFVEDLESQRDPYVYSLCQQKNYYSEYLFKKLGQKKN